ncbi:hypothetical protein [Gemmatimonas sp.]|uniref:hypothetical protein n=1 Tax=Gemmatimonas sp. TaxID=1962908 RepID=UPI00334186C6
MSVATMLLLTLQLTTSTSAVRADTILNAMGRGQPAVTTAVPTRQPVRFDASRFDSLTANALRSLFDEAAEMGLPVRPLINRALEGAARRMPGDRILRVVREHAAALQTAKRALGDGSTEDELEAGAIAVRAGLDERTLESVRSTRPAGQAVVPLVVLTDIVRRGVPAPSAREAVQQLARTPRSDEVLMGLQATVAKNAQRGPGMALDALNRYVRGTGSSSPVTPATTDRKPVRPPDP